MQPPRSSTSLLLAPFLGLVVWCPPARTQDPLPAEKASGSAPVTNPASPDKPASERPATPPIRVPSRVSAPPTPPAMVLAVDPKAELEKLQGSWDCVEWVYSGTRPDHNGRIYHSRYEGNRITLFNKEREYRHGLVTLDTSRTPMAMNTWDLDGPFADKTNRGIYTLDGDTLKICVSLDATMERPTDFTSEVGSRRLLITYKRRQP